MPQGSEPVGRVGEELVHQPVGDGPGGTLGGALRVIAAVTGRGVRRLDGGGRDSTGRRPGPGRRAEGGPQSPAPMVSDRARCVQRPIAEGVKHAAWAAYSRARQPVPRPGHRTGGLRGRRGASHPDQAGSPVSVAHTAGVYQPAGGWPQSPEDCRGRRGMDQCGRARRTGAGAGPAGLAAGSRCRERGGGSDDRTLGAGDPGPAPIAADGGAGPVS